MDEWIVAFYKAMGLPVEAADLAAAARSAFERERKAAGDRLWGLKKLRGAETDPDLIQLITDCSNILKAAADQAKAANTAAGIEQASVHLKTMEAKARQAEQAAKRVEAVFAKDLEAMPKYLAMLEAARKARDTIGGLPGTTEQLVKIEELLARGQAAVVKDGILTRGHAAALDTLAKHGAILEEARAASDAFMKTDIPREVMDAWTIAKSKLVQHANIAPEFQTRLYEKQLAEKLNAGRQDAKQAVADLQGIAKAAEDEVRAQRQLKEDASADHAALGVLFGELAGAGVPAAGYAHAQQEKLRAEKLMADDVREYRSAAEILKEAREICASMLALHKSAGKQWTAQSKALGDIKRSCGDWKLWAPLSARAQYLFDDAVELESDVAKTNDFAAASERFAGLEARFAVLEAEAKTSIPRGADLKAFAKDLAKARDEVDKVRVEAGTALAKLEEKMEGVENRKASSFHLEFDQCYEVWIRFAGAPAAETVKHLDKRKKEAIDDLRAIKSGVEGLLKKPAELARVLTRLKADDQEQAKAGRMAKIESLLRELEKFDSDAEVERLRKEARDAVAQELNPAGGRVTQLEQDLLKKLTEARKLHEEKVKKAKAIVADNKKALDRLESDNRDFKQYVAELKARADDLQALIDDGDPYLYKLATEESAELVKRMKAISPEFRQPGAKTFDDVEKKWTAMSNELGKGDLIKKRLPDTYAQLYARLQAAVVKARASDPDEGLKSLEALAGEITQAAAKAATEDTVFKNFEGEKKLVEARWSEITKLTKTWITDRTKSYEARFKTLLADATTTAGQEGKINDAIKKLGDLKAELDTIANSPNPREALQAEDAKATRQQQLVVDMARQFEASLEAYEEKTIPDLRKALKGVKGADLDQLDSLEKAGEHAMRVVQPYLNILSKLPHKQLTANSAPMPDKALADFAQAQKMLADAARTARHLAANPEGTNVKFSGDLTRVATEWAKYANVYAAGIKEMTSTIKEEVKSEGADIKKLATKVTGQLTKATTRFDAVAFAGPLKVLSNEKAKAEAKLAAREEALRTLREYKQDILTDPLLVRINDPKNPFKNVNRETGMLRATLKKLELEVLGGV